MCVAIFKPAGIKSPSIETLKSCWDANPDGAGMAWRTSSDKYPIHIEKGFMKWDEFKSFWQTAGVADYDGDLFIHFRITTHGGTSDGNTHPFPISNNDKILKSLSMSSEFALMHNGILPISPDNASISDTMMLSKLIARGGFHTKIKDTLALIEELVGANKIAVMTASDVHLIGNWKDVDGVKFSNLNWQWKTSAYAYDNKYIGYYTKPTDKHATSVSDSTITDDSDYYDDCCDEDGYYHFIATHDEIKELEQGLCPWCLYSDTLTEYHDRWVCDSCGTVFEKNCNLLDNTDSDDNIINFKEVK
jgi:ribosomal protein S27AE